MVVRKNVHFAEESMRHDWKGGKKNFSKGYIIRTPGPKLGGEATAMKRRREVGWGLY